MDKIKVFIIATMSGSFSVLANIKLFAKDLIDNNFDVVVLIPEKSEYLFEKDNFKYITYMEESKENFKSTIINFLNKNKADIILFSNYYFTHPFDLIDSDLTRFLELHKSIKVTIDPFLLHLNKSWPFDFDLSCFGNMSPKKISQIPGWLKVIQYGQINKIDPDVYYYNHIPMPSRPISQDKKYKILKKYIKNPELKRNLFFSINKTHLLSIKKFYPKYLDLLCFVLDNIFEDARKQVRLIFISNETTIKDRINTIEAVNIPELDYDNYNELISSADLFLTDNSLTDSLFYAGAKGINSIVFYNSVPLSNGQLTSNINNININNKLEKYLLEHSISLPKFRVLPFGWYDQWEKFDSHYFDGVDFIHHLELFDIEANKSIISSILFDEKKKQELSDKRNQYFNKLTSLPSPSDIINKIINDHKK